ncbi:MAG: DUF4369 domain-containing protein [Porphyromonas sp.]|nr:DUF4369 domain-containing protein [Porphyromonas sp.]
MKRYTLLAAALLITLFAGCKSDPTFKISGSVAGAKDKVLYLEHEGLQGTTLVDSVKLDEKGDFKFTEDLPEYPDFYRLRLEKQRIPFVVDSMNYDIVINTDVQSFATSYSVTGSLATEQIREIWLANLDANVMISRLRDSFNEHIIDEETFIVKRDSVLDEYKSVATKYIYNFPGSSVAYFALFQQVNGQLIFNLYDPIDFKAFGAVANVMNSYYPENPRTKHLYDLTLRALAVIRQARDLGQSAQELSNAVKDEKEVQEIGYIDFTLPDMNGDNIQLSSVVQQSAATLLCFTTMDAEWSGQMNQVLGLLYREYSSKGLSIYQVGLDSDNHIWRTSVAQLPWINVQDKHGVYSNLVGLYNVNTLPTIYLINSQGEIETRVVSLEELPDQIERIL